MTTCSGFLSIPLPPFHSSLSSLTTTSTAPPHTTELSPSLMAHPSSFHACYGLRSINPAHKDATYIGYTVHPARRLRQHNGDIASGAKKTSKKRPWEMKFCVFGFPSHHQGLKFEFSWQHPKYSRRLVQTIIDWKRIGGSRQPQPAANNSNSNTNSPPTPTLAVIRKERILMHANKRGYEGLSFALALLLSTLPWRSMGLKVVCDVDAFKTLLTHFYTIEHFKAELIAPPQPPQPIQQPQPQPTQHSKTAKGKELYIRAKPSATSTNRKSINSADKNDYTSRYLAQYQAAKQLQPSAQNGMQTQQNGEGMKSAATSQVKGDATWGQVNADFVKLSNIEYCEQLQWFICEPPFHPSLFSRPTTDDFSSSSSNSTTRMKSKGSASKSTQSSRELVYHPAIQRLFDNSHQHQSCGICTQPFQTAYPQSSTTTTNALFDLLPSNDLVFTPLLYELDFHLSANSLFQATSSTSSLPAQQLSSSNNFTQQSQLPSNSLPTNSNNNNTHNNITSSTIYSDSQSMLHSLMSDEQLSSVRHALSHSAISLPAPAPAPIEHTTSTPSQTSQHHLLLPPHHQSQSSQQLFSPPYLVDQTLSNLDITECPHCHSIFHLLCVFAHATHHQRSPPAFAVPATRLNQQTPYKVTPCKTINKSLSQPHSMNPSRQLNQNANANSNSSPTHPTLDPTSLSPKCSTRLIPEYFQCSVCHQTTPIALLLADLHPTKSKLIRKSHVSDDDDDDDDNSESDLLSLDPLRDTDDDDDDDDDDGSNNHGDLKHSKPSTAHSKQKKQSAKAKSRGTHVSKKRKHDHSKDGDDHDDDDGDSIDFGLPLPFTISVQQQQCQQQRQHALGRTQSQLLPVVGLRDDDYSDGFFDE